MDSGYFGPLFAFLLFTLLIAGPVFYVVTSWFLMKIFEKAGVEGKWRAWVPIYNMAIFAKLGDVSPWVALGAIGLTLIPYLNTITSIAATVLFAVVAYRVGMKLQKEGAWVVLWVLLAPVWLGIMAFDSSRWNTAVPPAQWAGSTFLGDSTRWEGVPVQPGTLAAGFAPAQGGYAPQGAYAPDQGYQPGQGYAPPAPQYGDPAQTYGAPQPPTYGTQPPAYGAEQYGAPDATQPSADGAPPAPPAPGTDPNRPPA